MIDNYIYTISLGRTLSLFQLDLDLDLASVSHACSGSGLCFLITLGGVRWGWEGQIISLTNKKQ